MYSKISIDNINKVKDILYNSEINGKEIRIDIKKLNISIDINEISIPGNIDEYICESFFRYNGSNDVVKHDGNKYDLGIEMREEMTIDNGYSINVSLDCLCNDFGIGFGRAFYQIELSEALEDKENIYILRNITQLLNNASSSKIEEFNCEILSNRNESFLIISKFKKTDLSNVKMHGEIFCNFLNNFIRCAFINEALKIELYNE